MSQTETEIRELETRITQAELVTDPEFFEAIIDERFSFVDQLGKVFGKQEVVDAHRPAGAHKFKTYEPSDLKVRDFGDTAIVTLRVALSTAEASVVLEFMRVWLKRDGNWKIIGGSVVQLEHSH